MSVARVTIIALFAAASLLRLADVFRPIDRASWRECDLGSISRNFAIEGMNPLFPRIDWRGSGPGYVEMELPIYPFLTAIAYKLFGIHDWFGRGLAFIFSIASLFIFFRLAREYLDLFPTCVAFAFFALNPLVVDTATSIQPEGLMLALYLTTIYFFVRWLKTERVADFWVTVAATALTLLAKAPAAHIGLFCGILLIEKYGFAVIRQARAWLLAVLSILPAAAWYAHARNLWLTYGNSLGVSNEYHWIGWDFFTDASFLEGILRSELFYSWAVFGVIVGAFAIVKGRGELCVRHALAWLTSIFALYLLAARTTSEDWANYYHVFSIPPVALIFGVSIKKLWDFSAEFAERFSLRSRIANLAHVAVILAVIASIYAALVVEAKQVRANFLDHRVADPSFVFANKIKPRMRSEGLILVSGGRCRDDKGFSLAYDASFMFYWLERKGWSICVEEQSVPQINSFARNGARYFVAQRSYMMEKPGLEAELRKLYRVLDESSEFVVYDLTEAPS